MAWRLPQAVEEAPPQERGQVAAAAREGIADGYSSECRRGFTSSLRVNRTATASASSISSRAILAGSVGWGRAEATPLAPRQARSRWPGVLLVTNLVLVAAAAVAAIAFLIAAWVS